MGILYGSEQMRVADLGEQSPLPDLFGEASLQSDLTFDLSEYEEIYGGYGKCENAYPYRLYNGYNRHLSVKEVQTITLENDALCAVFLPEYGGRLWKLYDKVKQRNLLYTNDVLQFANLAVRNAWFSGGVEWNISVIGHTPLTTEPLYTGVLNDQEGHEILRMYEFERIRQVIYQMDFWLEGECLYARMRIMNENKHLVPMYWWSNMAVPEYQNGHIIVPATSAYTEEEGRTFKVDLPYVHERDITDYTQIRDSVDYFFDIPNDKPKYIANIDENGVGLLHVSTNRLRSRKLFTWGNNQASDRWQDFLTDQAGRYLEIQAGLGKTQYGCIPMAPQSAWEWLESYSAVKIPETILGGSHAEKSMYLTDMLDKASVTPRLEDKLISTREMAKRKAKVKQTASGYGSLTSQSMISQHIEFVGEKDLKDWKLYFTEGEFPQRDPQHLPDHYFIDADNYHELEKRMSGKNEANWYAWYQLGLGAYLDHAYEKAQKAFERSLAIAPSPWAYHGLACVELKHNRTAVAAEAIQKGLSMCSTSYSYLLDGFKILKIGGENQKIVETYETLAQPLKDRGRLKYYYIYALSELGEIDKAYDLMIAENGLEIADIREGDNSLAELYTALYQKKFGKTPESIPVKYQFKANK